MSFASDLRTTNSLQSTTSSAALAIAGASAGASSGGNVQNTTITESSSLDYSGSYKVKNTPGVIAPNTYPTAPCMGSSSVGGSGVGFGVSFGTSWTDKECGLRETARSFMSMGLPTDALAILCSSEFAAAAPSCNKGK